MHIFYLIPSLDGSGGAEQAVAGLAGPLVERGVDLDVVTFAPRPGPALGGDRAEPGGPAAGADPESGDLAAAVRAVGARVSMLPPTRRRGAAGQAERMRALRSLVVERRPDLVHTTLFDADLVGRVAARSAGVAVVSSLVNVAYGPEQRANPAVTPWKLEVVHWADRLSAKGVRRFHALSPHVAEVMGPRLGIRADRIDVIPRGRDRARLGEATPSRRARVRAALGVADEQLLVLAAARHEYQKGLDVLIRAWPTVRRTHPGAQLRIGGRRGSQSALLEALADEQGPDAGIAWLGRRDDVADLLVAADTFVVPSRWEGFGSILVEAMALGAPLVTTDVGPIPGVVGEGWARLVPAEDPVALARAVAETLDQTQGDRAERAAIAAQRFASSYDQAVVADATVEFYRRALG